MSDDLEDFYRNTDADIFCDVNYTPAKDGCASCFKEQDIFQSLYLFILSSCKKTILVKIIFYLFGERQVGFLASNIMKFVLPLLLFFAIACATSSGGSSNISSSSFVTEETAEYTSYSSGITIALEDQRTVITEQDDLEFYHRLLTGEITELAEVILQTNDVLMVIHTRNNTKGDFKISSITTLNEALTVYYYHEEPSEIGQTDYDLFYIPKTTFPINFIEIVPQ
jgi:hypothetical protein